MKIEFRASFAKDLRKLKDVAIKKQVAEIIFAAEQARAIHELESVKKLRGTDNFYRIRLGDYRIGLVTDGDLLIFVRFLHRKDIYRYFP